MIQYEIWVRPEKYLGEDEVIGPTPEEASLKEDTAYRVLGIIAGTDQEKEAFVTIANDEGEIWFISNRHLRVVQVDHLHKNSVEGSIPWVYPVEGLHQQ